MSEEFWNCPHCGASLKNGATVCHNCGSDSETGWSEFCYLDGADWIHEEWEPEEEKKTNWSLVFLVLLIVIVIILSVLR